MALTKLATVLNKISTLATVIKGQQVAVKAAFDHDVNVVKDYVNNTLTEEIQAQFATKEEVAGIVSGQIPDNSLTNSKLAPEIKISSLYTATNAGNNYSITPNPAISAYSDGITLKIKVNADSTGNTTLNVNSLGIKNILKANGVNATSLKANGVYTVVYSSGNFILQGEGASGNATASDLLSGKTASTDAGDITGTMADNGAVTITPGTTNQVIPAGKHNGSGYVAGDADLVASNILNTANIFGVQGSAIAGKRFASGTATSTSSTSVFKSAGINNDISCNSVTVSGLSFLPSIIILNIFDGMSECATIYRTNGLYYAKVASVTTIDSSSDGAEFAIKADVSPAYVNSGGFCLPATRSNSVFNWIAIE